MKKIALIIDIDPDNPESRKSLQKLAVDFGYFGAEVTFFGEKADGMIKPLDDLRNFEGIVIDLAEPYMKSIEKKIFSPSDLLKEGKTQNSVIDIQTKNEMVIPENVKNLKVTVKGVFLDKSGYALHTRNMALGLHRLGADVELKNLWFAGAPEMKKVDPDIPHEPGFIYITNEKGEVFQFKSQVDPEQTAKIIELGHKKLAPQGRTLIVCLPAWTSVAPIYKRVREDNLGYEKYIGYTMFETSDLPHQWVLGCEFMDEIWVPSRFNFESFTQAGIPAEKIKIVPLGVDVNCFDPQKTIPMQIPGTKGFNFLSIFQWTKRKGWDILLKAYLKAFTFDDDVALVIKSYYGNGREVESLVRQYVAYLGFDINKIPRISVISQPLLSQQMPSLYKACHAFVLPTRGEGWGLPFMEAMSMGLPTIGTRFSAQLDFMNDENSYLIDNLGTELVDEEQVMDNPSYLGTSWGIPSLEHTIELIRYIYEHQDEAKLKGKRAQQDISNNWTVEHQVARTAKVLLELPEKPQKKAKLKQEKPLRIALQNRSNCLQAPGGDTVVMQFLKQELQNLGLKVDFNLNVEDLSDYDLVHIFNFVLPEMVKLYAENSTRQEKPFIITPMWEDWSLFLNKSYKAYYLFKEYIERGQPRDSFEEIFAPLKRVKSHPPVDNSYSIRLSAGITPSGESEALRIKSAYPFARNVVPVYLGCDITKLNVGPDLFLETLGLKDFVLCVARLETRKNQLMLLKALENEEVPLVFVTSGFTYQEHYADLCMEFKRKGPTVFLGRLSDEMLVSAYKAAKVHALPSWYELPGMVSVEAAHYDCNVVASPWGTIKDYLGDYAYYAPPDNPEGIRQAVLKAFEDPVKPGLRELVQRFTWELAAKTTLEVYYKALEEHSETNFWLQKAKSERTSGRKEEALNSFNKVLEIHPDNVEALSQVGEILTLQKNPQAEAYLVKLNLINKERQSKNYMTVPRKMEQDFVFEEQDPVEEAILLIDKGNFLEAERLLEETLKIEVSNARALFGLGKIQFLRGKYARAREYLQKSVDLQPTGENLLALVEVFEKLNQCDQALSTLDLLRELPGLNGNFDFDIFRLKGHCLLRKGNLEGAEICYHNSLIIDRTSEKPYLGLGSVALMKRNYIQAKQYYAKALQINPESDKAHLGLALLNSEQARYEETLSEAIKALELNIENQQALMLCLEAGYRCGRLIDAERFLSKYSELHPANAELVYTLAGVRNKIGDREGALKAARQVLMFHPDFQPATELLIQMG